MELDEMKTAWKKIDSNLQQQKLLTDKLIIDMTKERYRNRFTQITTYESIATLICFGTAIYIILNINKLDTWYFLISGILMIILLITLPILSLVLLKKLRNIDIKNNNYKESLVQFATRKEKFLLFQKVTLYLNMALVLIILPLFAKLFHNKDIFGELKIWSWYLPVMFMLLLFFSRWVYNGYRRITDHAGKILKEMEVN